MQCRLTLAPKLFSGKIAGTKHKCCSVVFRVVALVTVYRHRCAEMGARLVSLETEGEDDFVNQSLLWIGFLGEAYMGEWTTRSQQYLLNDHFNPHHTCRRSTADS